MTNSKGYILQLSRIVNPYVKDRSKLRPVLLHHGFQCTGTLFIITNEGRLLDNGQYIEFDREGNVRNGTPNTLGFMLATTGYDVWLANYRGSIYSSNHTTLSTDRKFSVLRLFFHFPFIMKCLFLLLNRKQVLELYH